MGVQGEPKPGQGRYLPPGRGRPKGSVDKIGRSVKESILEVFVGLGGIEAMTEWAKKHQSEFYKCLFARLIPTQITGTIDVRDASEFTDDELAQIIANGSGARDAVAQAGESITGAVH